MCHMPYSFQLFNVFKLYTILKRSWLVQQHNFSVWKCTSPAKAAPMSKKLIHFRTISRLPIGYISRDLAEKGCVCKGYWTATCTKERSDGLLALITKKFLDYCRFHVCVFAVVWP